VDPRTGESNVAFLRKHLAGRAYTVVTFASWDAGLLVARGNPKKIRGVADLVQLTALPVAALGRQEHEEGVAALVVERQDVVGAHFVALQLQHQLRGHGEDLVEGLRAVVVLDLGQLGHVDQEQTQAAVVAQGLAEVGDPLPVGDDLGVHP
jgi:hypothetical protein